jgi:hypothetical protein
MKIDFDDVEWLRPTNAFACPPQRRTSLLDNGSTRSFIQSLPNMFVWSAVRMDRISLAR